MRNFRSSALLFTAPLLLVLACDKSTDGDDTSVVATDDTGSTDTGPASWEDARPIIEAHCARCHADNRLSTYRPLDTHEAVTELRSSILDKISESPPRGQRMPLASNHTNDEGCVPEHVQLNDKRLSDEEIAVLTEYLNRDDHRDYVDETERISAPAVPALADSTAYTSTQYEVLNDGFVTPPDGAPPGYMEDLGYDQRDFDQMEDDWFCIEFDPELTEASFLTGLQVQTESGQIFLNSQVVIDTTDGSTAAKAAADEKGDDWYRCDPGLGFSDAIPLWRTVPGGEAIELPDQTGLRIEPGWKFVMRVDFHTHYDKDEFERLDQNGIIDTDEGTMTWFDRATLRARWAPSSDITRELKWLTVGPSTPTERANFAVAPGESNLTYSATLPSGDTGNHKVFSAEVSMGKNGHVASLRDSSTSTCVANNSNFSPKWIEQAIYGEDDAPILNASSSLDLRCSYDNESGAAVDWGPEGEAAVWGRKERCFGVVFYYGE